MRISRVMVGVALSAAVVTAAACSRGEAEAQRPAASSGQTPGSGGGRGGGPNAVVPVTVAQVEQTSMPITIQGIGTVIAASTVAVHAQITGEMTSVQFKEGEDVKEGQVLVTLDRRPLEAALNQAEAQLAKDQAQAVNAHAQASRYQDLLKRGIATKEQVDAIVTQAASLDATIESDKAAIDNAKVQLQYATIRAPMTGRTGLLQVHPGNLVRAGDTQPIVTINKITPVYVSFSIPEAQLPALKRYVAQSGTLPVTAKPPTDEGQPSVGRLNFIDNAVDPATGTIKIKGTFPNDDRRLWPGQFVNATVTLTQDPNAIVVPAAAVQNGQSGQYVYVVKPDKTAEMRPVIIARTAGDRLVIQSGVKGGETVVTDGFLRLVPGSRVSIKGTDAPKATS
ncbi:MAG TPA: efflux RND transporter periplasmic adaptor subunit [Vicinamibacterales bacterium]|nr:efflux RND transporter periplasmic adaptor subunit [Vicinamibacterales bacterium]